MNNKKIRVVFMGSPEFAIPSLDALYRSDEFSVVGVVTSPPRPKGRKKTPISTPVETHAKDLGIPVHYSTSFKQESERAFLSSLEPDVIVVVAFGQILPPEVISLPRFGAINVHASLLPKYRGASPIQAAILEGEDETGITVMLMDEGLDTGPIITQQSEDILPEDTFLTLGSRLAQLGGEILPSAILSYIHKTVIPVPQVDRASKTRIIKKEDGRINWNTPADKIERMTRAYAPWPGAWTLWGNRRVRILCANRCKSCVEYTHQEPGTVVLVDDKLGVVCGNNTVLLVSELQLEGKHPQPGEVFIHGYSNIIESKLV